MHLVVILPASCNDPSASAASGPWFESLPAVIQKEVTERIHVRHRSIGEPLFTQGQEGTGLHCLIEGQIHVTASTVDGGSVLMGILRPGDWVGFLAALDGGAYVFTATCVTKSETATLPCSDVRKIFECSVERYKHLVTPELVISRRNYHFLIERHGSPALQRLAERLLDLGRWPYSPPGGPVSDLEGVSQEQLAEATRVSRQTVNEALRLLEKRGVVAHRRGHIVVLDIPALIAIAAGDKGPSP